MNNLLTFDSHLIDLENSKILKLVFRLFVKKGVEVLLVGSLARGEIGHDIDLIVVHQENQLDFVREVVDLHKQLGVSFQQSDDVWRFFDKDLGKEVSYLLIKKTDFNSKLRGIYAGKRDYVELRKVFWALGGYFPETFLFDIFSGKKVIGGQTLSKWKAKLKIYPPNLRERLIDDFWSEYNYKENLEVDGWLNYLKKIELRISFLRAFFADRSVFFPGLKKISQYFNAFNEKDRQLLIDFFKDADCLDIDSYIHVLQSS